MISRARFQASATLSRGFLYFRDEDTLYALLAATGEEVWSHPLQPHLSGSGAIAIESGLVIVLSGGLVHAFEEAGG